MLDVLLSSISSSSAEASVASILTASGSPVTRTSPRGESACMKMANNTEAIKICDLDGRSRDDFKLRAF